MVARLFLLMIGLSISMGSCLADDNKAGKDSVKRVQQMLRKVEQEKAQLAQEKEQLTQQATAAAAQLKESTDKLAASQRRAGGLAAKTGALEKELEAAKSEKDALAAKLAETEKQRAETLAKLRETETERRRLEALGARQKETIVVCQGNNAKLYQYGAELLDQYNRKSCGDALLQFEPVTGIKRVEIENLVEDYRERLDEQKLPPAGNISRSAADK
jgi:chromosome segregation ATPase